MAAEDSPAVIHNPMIVKPILDLITIPSFAFSTTKLNHCRWHRFKGRAVCQLDAVNR
jgi:hypothetical protein